MRKTRATIKEVAVRCGVHASTVSRVLNPETRTMVSAKVAETVLRAARELGYLRNPLASGLRTRRSHTVGILIPDLSNPLFPPIVRGIERTLDQHGYLVVLADSENSERTEHALVENLVARQVDGLILATAHRKDSVVEECIEHGIPFILVNRTVDRHDVTAVINDDECGIRLILEHLVGLGHKDIAFVGGPQNTSTGYTRYRAFLKVCKEFGIKINRDVVVNSTAFSEHAGGVALAAILDRSGLAFTAAVAANDLIALGCLDTLTARGLQCPRDVSVTGFNHMPFVDRMNPSLTTISIPQQELGTQAAQLLLERMRHPEASTKTVKLRPSLVIGRSTQQPSVKKRRSSSTTRAVS